jgi:DNA polymerase elongation subunit (family B)
MPEILEIDIKELHSYTDGYEVYDEEKNAWIDIGSSCYIQSGGFPDIEKADKEITAITLSRKGEKVVLGCGEYKPKSDNVHYLKCKDEWHLLNNFIRIWQSGRYQPDVLTGWNIEFFDLPYLVNRIRVVLGEHEAKKLSPWNI